MKERVKKKICEEIGKLAYQILCLNESASDSFLCNLTMKMILD